MLNKLDLPQDVYHVPLQKTDLESFLQLTEKLDKRNFRKKIFSIGILEVTKHYKKGTHRPALLYKFKKVKPASTLRRVQFEK